MNEDDSPESRSCPKCGLPIPADAPEGLCPKCLGAFNLTPETVMAEDPDSAPPRTAPPAPEEIAPHFPQLEILECLGRGGMGVVYKARQKTLGRVIALKILAPERVKDPAFAERFGREAKTLAAMNHPNIVTIHDFGESDGLFFLLMEFVDGVNLRQAIKSGRFTPEEALAIVPPVCEALQYAHERGIVHRDIKPENLLMDKEGQVMIADFGIARMLEAETGDEDEAAFVGTPRYMAPEQIEDSALVDSRADIYSLGVVLYEMLTGEPPGDRIEPPSARVKDVQIDVRLDEIVLRALAEKPEMRFQTAGDFKTRLQTVTTPSGQLPTPPQVRTTPASSKESRWWLPAFGSLWLVAALVLMLGREVARTQPLMYSFFGKGAWLSPGAYHGLVIACVLIGVLFFGLWWSREKFGKGISRTHWIWAGLITGALVLWFLVKEGIFYLQTVHLLMAAGLLGVGLLLRFWSRRRKAARYGRDDRSRRSVFARATIAAGIAIVGIVVAYRYSEWRDSLAGRTFAAAMAAGQAEPVGSQPPAGAGPLRVDRSEERERESRGRLPSLGHLTELLRYGPNVFISNFKLDENIAEALGLELSEIERIEEAYRSAAIAFSEARRGRMVAVPSGEPGVFWGEVAPFPERAAAIRREMKQALVDAIGSDRAHLLANLMETSLREETADFGRLRERVAIERKDGKVSYRRLFTDPQTGEKTRSGGSGWLLAEDEEARTSREHDTFHSLMVRAAHQRLGIWPRNSEQTHETEK